VAADLARTGRPRNISKHFIKPSLLHCDAVKRPFAYFVITPSFTLQSLVITPVSTDLSTEIVDCRKMATFLTLTDVQGVITMLDGI
jgi:hypothetical protein